MDQIDTEQPLPQRATPQRWPDCVGFTVQPSSSAWRSAASTSFFGWRRRTLTIYNSSVQRSKYGAGRCESGQ